MLVYSKRHSPRLEYISAYFLQSLCGIDISFTNNAEEFKFFDGPSFCYDDELIKEDAFHVIPHGLLFENSVQPQAIKTEGWRNTKIFFTTNGSSLPFDILAASFFLISRYEEYLPHEKDSYGRFAHANSLAAKNDFLDLPVINCWAMELRRILQRKFPSLICHRRTFQFLPTYDIDMAWTYLHKGWVRNATGFARSLIQGQWGQLSKRVDVLTNKRPDPFDVYEWLDALHIRYSLKPYYFFLLSEDPKGYDTNIDPYNKAMKDLVSYHSMGYPVGIHPSWQSGDNSELLQKEISLLQKIKGRKVTASRFHYIRFDLPGGYRKLIEAGIEDDFSMGYGSINGFRASVSTPFEWYDLEKDEKTSLVVHPFCWMDANSHYEQKYTPAQAYPELKNYHEIIKQTEGEMSIISHNSFFSDEPEFEGWKNLYEIFLREVVYWDL